MAGQRLLSQQPLQRLVCHIAQVVTVQPSATNFLTSPVTPLAPAQLALSLVRDIFNTRGTNLLNKMYNKLCFPHTAFLHYCGAFQ